ncbi:uncharacterized protein LOC111404441 [Olea europaea var. sylvestris]|uniref:uncharacterized protein LOC111404441 n=1 Tax=Olea europaea var. sylvestris TaxID=158386 RepID=UPI000C1D4602|nr:uncharacterized protein LOC111404441 [Olea europaea var. sylvestris]
MNEEVSTDKDNEPFSLDLIDPANWGNMNTNLRDLIVLKGLLFKNDGIRTQLAHDGINDWKNIGEKLKMHEVSCDHINNMTFRGDNKKIYQENNGIFLSMIQMITEFDPVMQEHVCRIKNKEIHYHYLGHKIQNELILMLAGEIKKIIIEKLKNSKYFFVILDCTPDTSHEEQMSIILRCVDISASPVKVEEFFLGFLLVDDTSGKGLFDELVDALNNLELDIDDVRGQGYDNGANMKGQHKGVQSRLLQLNPRAFYSPCGCHSLNLALCDMWKIFKENVTGLTIKPSSQTRWESHIESVRAIRFQAPQIKKALLQLANIDDPKTKSGVVSKHLQAEDMHIDVAIDHLKGLISFFKSYRESDFESAMVDAKEITTEKSFKINYFLYIVDRALSSFENRFEEAIFENIFGAIDVLDYIKRMNCCFANAWIAYRVLLTIPVTVASAEKTAGSCMRIYSTLFSLVFQAAENCMCFPKFSSCVPSIFCVFVCIYHANSTPLSVRILLSNFTRQTLNFSSLPNNVRMEYLSIMAASKLPFLLL